MSACLAVAAMPNSLSAQGTLRRGVYSNSELGFQLKVPAKWTQVPTQVDERWVVAQFQSDMRYEGHVKLDGPRCRHRPTMRVIKFDEAVSKDIASVGRDADDAAVRTHKRPYRNYRDYVKRNSSKGGFYFSVEKPGAKLGKYSVDIYEVKVEKLSRNGRRHYIAYVFRGTGIDFAVEFDFLEYKFKKLKSSALRCFRSFKLIPRTTGARQSSGIEDRITGTWLDPDWKNKSAAERRLLRRKIAELRARRAIAGLPRGWRVSESKHFTILSNASKKHTSRLVKSAETCRTWLDKRFGAMNDEYVSKGILRICRNYDEFSVYRTRSSDAVSLNNREIATYENKNLGNGAAFGPLFYSLYTQFMAEKHNLLHSSTPYWLRSGMEDYLRSARVRGSKIEFTSSTYVAKTFRLLRRSKVEPRTPRQLMNLADSQFSKGNKKDPVIAHQLETFFRFIESSRKQPKILESRGSDFVLDYLRESMKAAEEYETARKASKPSSTAAVTEAEEEERTRQRSGRIQKRRNAICKAVNGALCGWSDTEWQSLDRAYRVYLKQQKYL
ncbi:MAG: hypothetical protein VX951_01690 [Planctomycetota bacterium]|nr:hypothetical protein [Planctomycetota bacterium]